MQSGRPRPLVRIGLSATQKPIEIVAQFLTGNGRPEPAIVDIGHQRPLDLAVEVPASELGPVASKEMWEEIYDRIAELVRQHRSTLVFVNTRRLAERVAHLLSKRLGEEAVAAHHGSLSRKLRLAAERKLKAGEARVLVATASLELGIDIGTVDLVCQISSPRSIALALQRIGRAGHWRGAVPKGHFFALTRDDLLECAALVRAIRGGELDRIEIPEAPLDVLAQQIVAMCACEEWKDDDLFQLVCRAYPYRTLSRTDFDSLLEMLSEGISARRGRYSAYLYHDHSKGRLRGRRGSRLVAITNGGAIPENALYTVVAMPEGTVVGTVDEDFAVESLSGDVILLGNNSWRIRRVEGATGRVLVEDAHGAPPGVPFWRGEAPARTPELSEQVADLRAKVCELISFDARGTLRHAPAPEAATLRQVGEPSGLPSESEALLSNFDGRVKPSPTSDKTNVGAEVNTASAIENRETQIKNDEAQQIVAAIEWLKNECGLDEAGAEQAVQYVLAGRAVLGTVPTETTVVAERFFDEAGGMQLIIHAPFGGRINKTWGLALRKRFCRSFNFELQAAATDNGLNISLGEQQSFPLADVFRFLDARSVGEVLEQAALASPVFTTRWRWDATRALALLRFRGGRKIPLPIQRMQAEDLLASVFPEVVACQDNLEGDIRVPDHPLIREVMKDVFTEALDLEGLKRVLTGIYDGHIRCTAVDTPVPSLFSHEILNANPYAYLDDAPLEERRARAVSLRRVLPDAVLTEIGRLDPAAIDQVRQDAWPDVRDADDLCDALETLMALPEDFAPLGGEIVSADWGEFFDQLVSDGRATRARHEERTFWVAARKAGRFEALFPGARFHPGHVGAHQGVPRGEDALLELVQGWIAHWSPVTSRALGQALGLAEPEIHQALLRLEAAGIVLRGQFTALGGTEWCERHLLARIHRLTLGALRKQIEPVTPAQFMQWLLRWQHVAPGTQVLGDRGLLEAIRQLQGFEIPANAWEPQVLSRRVAGYDPKTLDQLCLTGAVGWGRLSPHPATLDVSADAAFSAHTETRRVVPSSVAPITFFVREEADWMMPRRTGTENAGRGLSHAAHQVFEFLRLRGASFFADIVRSTGRLKSEVEMALWELVAAGLVTADGFDNLRALIDPKRRAGQGRGRAARPRHSSGRWAVLFTGEGTDRSRGVETICRVLLGRYGVVFRELLTRETFPVKWRELLTVFRRLEDRGEVRGGRFVDGFLGEQFALPLAVESLRALRTLGPSGETVTVSAADPLNLVGIIIPGERVPAISGRSIVLRDGAAVSAQPAFARIAAGI